MNRIGVVIEIKDGALKESNFGMITAARESGGELYALVIDGDGEAFKEKLERYGVHKIVHVSPGEHSDTRHPVFWSEAVIRAMERFEINIIFGLTSGRGRDLLPRIAASLDAPLVMDCIHVDPAARLARTSRYSGKTIATIKVGGEHFIFGIRPNVYKASPAPADAEIIPFTPGEISGEGMTVLQTDMGESDAVDLAEAEVIISGGRAMKSAENFSVLFECAEKLGAAVGASRAAVDAGWAPYPMQVGQTGVKVSPKVYIACGISGSVQHYAGMKTSGLIIAVNTDPKAAIVSACDYYITADLFEIAPLLTRQL